MQMRSAVDWQKVSARSQPSGCRSVDQIRPLMERSSQTSEPQQPQPELQPQQSTALHLNQISGREPRCSFKAIVTANSPALLTLHAGYGSYRGASACHRAASRGNAHFRRGCRRGGCGGRMPAGNLSHPTDGFRAHGNLPSQSNLAPPASGFTFLRQGGFSFNGPSTSTVAGPELCHIDSNTAPQHEDQAAPRGRRTSRSRHRARRRGQPSDIRDATVCSEASPQAFDEQHESPSEACSTRRQGRNRQWRRSRGRRADPVRPAEIPVM